MSKICRKILHIDMDAFFAAVEQHDNPDYRNKPLIIGGGNGSSRGVISSCSYEARKFGLHSAMPIIKARQLCPQGIYVNGRMERYKEVSDLIMSIFKEFTPELYQVSIDEAFLDITGTERLFGSAFNTAEKIKCRVKNITGLTLSVGIAENHYLAKLASEYNKPNGIYEVSEDNILQFIDSHDLKKLWGIGKVMHRKLLENGIYTPARLRECSIHFLIKKFGEAAGNFLYKICRGMDPGICGSKKSSRSSISNEITLRYETANKELIRNKILLISENVFFRMKKSGKKGFTVFIKIKYSDFKTVSAQKTFAGTIDTSKEIFEAASELFLEKYDGSSLIRLIGTGITVEDSGEIYSQNELFAAKSEKQKNMEDTIFSLKKSGVDIKRASLIKKV